MIPVSKVSSEHLIDHLAPVDGDFFPPVVIFEPEFVLIESQRVQQCRVQIVRMNRAIDGRVADVIGGADDLAAPHAAAGEPKGVTRRGMVAAFFLAGAFSAGSAAEFAGPEDESAVE